MRLGRLACAAAVLCLACGVAEEGAPRDVDRPEPGTGEPAPDFVLPQLGGGELRMTDLAGKTLVLDFWATWCLPCEGQVPELNAVHEAHLAEADFALIGLSIDVVGADEVAAWTREHGVRYPIALASEDLARRYGVIGFPATVVVASNGEIHRRHVGPLDRDGIEKLVREARATSGAR